MRFFDGPDATRRAREAFDRADFTLDRLTERLGPNVFAHLASGELAPLLHATRDGDRLDVLLRLFVLGCDVPVARAGEALEPMDLGAWVDGGVIRVDGGMATSRVGIRPIGGPDEWLIAHDPPIPAGRAVPPDHVLGVSASAASLVGATIRRPIAAAFDLGTGGGIQALHASTHAERVVASDINPRALACALLTMELDGIDRVELREGDRFEPVQGERFDLVVANPPFVISPSRRYLFRDSGLPVDEVSRSIVRTTADHLVEGGHGQVLASWAHVAGEDWRERLAGWFAGTGCDALVLEREALDPAAHASSWLRQTEAPERWQPEYEAWMAYDREHRIEAIGLGLISMRRRTSGGVPWFRAEEAPQAFATPCGDHLGAIFELADFLEAHPGQALMEARLRVAPDVVLDERSRVTAQGWTPSDRRLRQTAGLRFEGRVNAGMAAIVAACDGRRPLRGILDEASEASSVAREGMADAALPVIRRLVEQGFLLPAV